MKSARQMNEEMLIERHAEHQALKYMNGANYTHIATINNLPISCMVYDKKGTAIELHISKICNERAWNKYTDQLSSPLELGVLTNNVGTIAAGLMKWFLEGGYSERYTYVKSKRARTLLRYACLLLAISHVMQHKYQDHGFVDGWVECEMGKIQTAQEWANEIHKAIGHAKKHDEDLVETQEAVYQKYLALLENRKHIAYEQLPSLPAGAPDPLALPDDDEGEEDE